MTFLSLLPIYSHSEYSIWSFARLQNKFIRNSYSGKNVEILRYVSFFHKNGFVFANHMCHIWALCQYWIIHRAPAKGGAGGVIVPPPPTFLLSKKQMTQLKMKMNTNLVSTKFFFFLLPTNHSKTMLFLIVS